MAKRDGETTSCTSDSRVLSRRDFMAGTGRRAVVVDQLIGPVRGGPHRHGVCSRIQQDEDTTAQLIENLGNRRWRHEHAG